MERQLPCPLDGRGIEPRRLSDEELERELAEVRRHAHAVEARKLALLAEIDLRATHRRDGHLSTRDWLTNRFHVSRSAAKADVKTAQALSAMPGVREALSEGEVSSSAVKVLTAAWEAHPDAFERAEAALVEAAQTRSADELRRVVQEWSQAVDEDGALERAERARERRRLSVCPTQTGMVRVDGELDPEGGEEVITALRAIVDADVHVGRATRVVPPASRRALVLRDRGCGFPRCGRPPRSCDAHHVVPWERGGETKLSNLVLLCRKHHRLVHEGGFRAQMLDGRPVFRRPDGSVLRDERAPP